MPQQTNSPWPVPQWVLRLIGVTSLSAALVSLAVYWFKNFPSGSNRRVDGRRPGSNPQGDGGDFGLSRDSPGGSSDSSSQSAPTPQTASAGSWSSRLLGGVMAGSSSIRKNRKRMTLSLKNTILWNPSSDVDVPNHAFLEHATVLLTRMAQIYDIHILVHVNSDDERSQIQELIENAGLLDSKSGLDPRKILYCSTEEGKIHMIRHIEPQVHVEGGWELDDGEDIVRKLRPFVSKLVWVITRRRRSSFNQANLKESDQGILGSNVELTEKLLDTSVAREAGFAVDQ